MSWDLNLCLDWDKKVLVPFHYFASTSRQLLPTSSHSFFPFLRLPTDLQLLVYEQCDGPTLFQLMQTCSHIRGPASKLFWTNSTTDHWYYYYDRYLFDNIGRGYTIIMHCPEFARFITRVEIYFIRIELHFYQGDDSLNRHAIILANARDFWNKAEKVFPALERVILSGLAPPRHFQSLPDSCEGSCSTVQIVVGCAPSHITVHVALFDDECNMTRKSRHTVLWEVLKASQPSWRILDSDWKPIRVLLPLRKWTVSPLGDMINSYQQSIMYDIESLGLKRTKIESYARYARQGIIRCPRLDCAAIFNNRDLWKQHLSKSSHDRFDLEPHDPMEELLCCKYTPKEETDAIEARQQRIMTRGNNTSACRERIRYGWWLPGSEQRRMFETEIIKQAKEENFFVPGELIVTPGYPLGAIGDWLHAHYNCGDVYNGGCPGPSRKHFCYEEAPGE